MKPIINRIITTLKGDLDVNIPGPLVLISGENWGRKSSIIESVSLGITARHRIGRFPSDLVRLTHGKNKPLSVRLFTSEGEASFVVPVERGKAKEPVVSAGPYASLDREALLPLASLRSLVDLTDTAARAEIFRRFGGVKDVPTPDGLSTSQLELWREGIKVLRTAGNKASKGVPLEDPSAILAALEGWMDSLKLALGRQIGAKEREVAGMSGTAAPIEIRESLITQLEKAKLYEARSTARAQLEGLRTQRTAAVEKLALARAAEDEAKVKAEWASEEAERTQGRIADAQAAIGTLNERIEASRSATVKADALIAVARGSSGTCPCCVGVWPHARAEAFARDLEALTRDEHVTIAGLRESRDAFEKVIQSSRVFLATAGASSSNALRQAASAVAAAQAEVDRLDAAIGALTDAQIDEVYDGPTISELEAQLRAISAAQVKQIEIDRLNGEINAMRLKQADAKRLEGAAKAALIGLIEQTRVAAEAAVNAYMPEGKIAKLDLAADRPWCVIGSDADTHERDAMSGAELSFLMIALALAYRAAGPCYLLLDDPEIGPLSARNLTRLLAHIEKLWHQGVVTQAFVATTPERAKAALPEANEWKVLSLPDPEQKK